jgi:hypothetical protein
VSAGNAGNAGSAGSAGNEAQNSGEHIAKMESQLYISFTAFPAITAFTLVSGVFVVKSNL